MQSRSHGRLRERHEHARDKPLVSQYGIVDELGSRRRLHHQVHGKALVDDCVGAVDRPDPLPRIAIPKPLQRSSAPELGIVAHRVPADELTAFRREHANGRLAGQEQLGEPFDCWLLHDDDRLKRLRGLIAQRAQIDFLGHLVLFRA